VTPASTNNQGSSGTINRTPPPVILPPAPVFALQPSQLVLPVSALGGALPMVLLNGQPLNVIVDPGIALLLNSIPGAVAVNIVFQPAPITNNPAERGSLGGGGFSPYAQPIDISIQVLDASGQQLALPGGDLQGTAIRIVLPVMHQPTEPGSVFAWLQAIYDTDGSFLGYIRPAATFDPITGAVTTQVGLTHLQGTLFLPAIITRSYVANHVDGAHIFSGPTRDAVDFGVAAPQFTKFTVVGPQVGGRVFVHNPVTDNYGWLDAGAVGPSVPP